MVGQFVFHRLTVLPFLCLVFGFQHIAAALQPSHSAPVALCTCPQSSSSASAQLAACPKVSDQVRGEYSKLWINQTHVSTVGRC
jgi:hypothetical protein